MVVADDADADGLAKRTLAEVVERRLGAEPECLTDLERLAGGKDGDAGHELRARGRRDEQRYCQNENAREKPHNHPASVAEPADGVSCGSIMRAWPGT